MTNENVPVHSLSDDELLAATRQLVKKSHLLEAELLAHLGEIDERGLYLDHSAASMFAFCVDRLGFSEDAAFNRIFVARAARRLPAILEALRSGSVHLAGLRLLAPHLTELNCELVLPQAAGKSKRMIEELVARIAPSPPVRTAIRRVPECPLASWSPIPTQPPPGTPMPPPTPGATSFCFAAAVQAASASAEASTGPACIAGMTSSTASPAPGLAGPAVPAGGAARRAVVAPLSAETFAVQFTAPRQLRDKLFEARALLRHRVPDGDLAAIIEKGLDLLIEKVKKERFGIGRKVRARVPTSPSSDASDPAEVPTPSEGPAAAEAAPTSVTPADSATRAAFAPELSGAPDSPGASEAAAASDPAAAPQSAAAPATATESPAAPDPENASTSGDDDAALSMSVTTASGVRAPAVGSEITCSRWIPDAIKRAVYERDGGCCSYTDAEGRRCGSREALTFDHVEGFARTHEHSVERIRILCANHNQREAEKLYGREFMKRAREKSAQRRMTSPQLAPGQAELQPVEQLAPGQVELHPVEQLAPGQAERSGPSNLPRNK